MIAPTNDLIRALRRAIPLTSGLTHVPAEKFSRIADALSVPVDSEEIRILDSVHGCGFSVFPKPPLQITPDPRAPFSNSTPTFSQQ